MSFFTLDEQQVMELIAQCVNLQDCCLAFPMRNASFLVSSTSALQDIILSHLEVFSVTADFAVFSAFNIGRIMDSLVLPVLQKLQIFGNSPYGLGGQALLEPLSVVSRRQTLQQMSSYLYLVGYDACARQFVDALFALRVLVVHLATGDVAPLL
ncbi:hypothetical protein C8R44DRAFT_880681 [Mycena epipterygia]|nr:hypothetical protein C8R44DRAFT_880681 [Mycena epipterygia]